MSRLSPRPYLVALAALGALAGPARADGPPPGALDHHPGHRAAALRHGGPHPHHAGPHGRHHLWRGHGPRRVAWAPPPGLAGPAFYAWPDPATVRIPVYNRPFDPPLYD